MLLADKCVASEGAMGAGCSQRGREGAGVFRVRNRRRETKRSSLFCPLYQSWQRGLNETIDGRRIIYSCPGCVCYPFPLANQSGSLASLVRASWVIIWKAGWSLGQARLVAFPSAIFSISGSASAR